jgi:hypothetical protein
VRRGIAGAFCSLALSALALSGCEAPVPATPTFAVDIRPIFEGHCVRCHGAGGSLNADPLALENAPPPNGFLGQYEDKADCTLDAAGNVPATCLGGALYEAKNGNIHYYINATEGLRMPMQPSEPLDSWELAVVNNWVAEPTPLP